MRVAVLGGGPAGLTAAYQLTEAGAAVELFEAGATPGGMAKTFGLWGQKVDLGPHRFFCTDDRVNRLWFHLAGADYRMVTRLTRIYYDRKFYDYPLKLSNVVLNLGPYRTLRCGASYAAQQIRGLSGTAEAKSFESWVVRRFGTELYKMFFKTYSEKLWGIPGTELDADFAAQRIRSFNFAAAVKSAIGWNGGGHRTLADTFAYPTGGSGMIYDRMADAVRAHGGAIHLECPIDRVTHRKGRITGIEVSGVHKEFDHVISSIPLPDLVHALGESPRPVEASLGRLRFRNTVLVYLKITGESPFADQWVYLHTPGILAGRVTNFRNWVPELYGTSGDTILTAEYWCNDGDELWREPEANLVARAARELATAGLIRSGSVNDGTVVRLHRSYPVYSMGYREDLAEVQDYLDGYRGLTAIGRAGAFKYNNQDHSILMGMLAADNVAGVARHDLWAVNTDYESYQESAQIGGTFGNRAALVNEGQDVAQG